MTIVTAQMSVSVDGFYAGPRHDDMRTWLEGIELDPVRVIATPEVTHIRYKVNGRQPLVLDNRGREEEPVPGSSKSSLGVSGGTGSG